VGREHGAGARHLEGALRVCAAGDLGPGQLQGCQRRVPLVQVDDPGLDSEGAQRADAPDPEQRVLGLARAAVADVELRGDPAVERGVLGSLGVEEKERHPTHVDAPDLRRDLPPPDGDGDCRREVFGVGDERGRQPLGIGVGPVLVLPARLIDPLEEVALAVEEADRHQRQRPI
jgi:hypothetical protein